MSNTIWIAIVVGIIAGVVVGIIGNILNLSDAVVGGIAGGSVAAVLVVLRKRKASGE